MKRLLVRQVNWLGDLVMTLPATRAVRDAFPDASLTVLVKSELASFYDGADWIDEVLPLRIAAGWRGVADQRRLVADLRRRHFDTALLFPRSFSSALAPALARIPRRIGWIADGRGFLLSDGYEYAGDFLQLHQIHDHLELVRRGLGVAAGVGAVPVPVGSANAARMRGWLERRRSRSGPLIALAVAAAYGPAKEWPAARYAELADRLAAGGAECVLVGSPDERERCLAVAAACSSEVVVAAGETTVGELVALLAQCDGFAGNDSGAMHVAASLGVATVGIFGSTRPARTGPIGPRVAVVQHPIECSPCLQRECRFGHYECLRSISVELVQGTLQRLLAMPTPAL